MSKSVCLQQTVDHTAEPWTSTPCFSVCAAGANGCGQRAVATDDEFLHPSTNPSSSRHLFTSRRPVHHTPIRGRERRRCVCAVRISLLSLCANADRRNRQREVTNAVGRGRRVVDEHSNLGRQSVIHRRHHRPSQESKTTKQASINYSNHCNSTAPPLQTTTHCCHSVQRSERTNKRRRTKRTNKGTNEGTNEVNERTK